MSVYSKTNMNACVNISHQQLNFIKSLIGNTNFVHKQSSIKNEGFTLIIRKGEACSKYNPIRVVDEPTMAALVSNEKLSVEIYPLAQFIEEVSKTGIHSAEFAKKQAQQRFAEREKGTLSAVPLNS